MHHWHGIHSLKFQGVNQNLWDLDKKKSCTRLMSIGGTIQSSSTPGFPLTRHPDFWEDHWDGFISHKEETIHHWFFQNHGFIIPFNQSQCRLPPSSQTKHFPTPLPNKNAPSSQTNATPVCFSFQIIIPNATSSCSEVSSFSSVSSSGVGSW